MTRLRMAGTTIASTGHGGRARMRYTKRERRLAVLSVLAVALAVLSTAVLGRSLLRGPTRPPESVSIAATPRSSFP